MGRVGEAEGWCILTTTAARTLPLARTLAAHGIEAWTPSRTERRKGRGKQRNQTLTFDIAIIPQFVFVAAAHVGELLRIRDLPTLTASPFPPFTLLRDRNRAVPVIRDASLSPLRAAEDRFRRSALRSTKQRVEAGTRVRIVKGAFAGMKGEVIRGGDKEARVSFGHGFEVTIASYLFGTDVVQDEDKPGLGMAA